jgi:hypothetical protein
MSNRLTQNIVVDGTASMKSDIWQIVDDMVKLRLNKFSDY